jgi:hypothetical protein
MQANLFVEVYRDLVTWAADAAVGMVPPSRNPVPVSRF